LVLPIVVIVAMILGSFALAMLFGVALGRASARADERAEEQFAAARVPRHWAVQARDARVVAPMPRLRAARLPSPVSYAGTAGLGRIVCSLGDCERAFHPGFAVPGNGAEELVRAWLQP
jgi:hypothetical protein